MPSAGSEPLVQPRKCWFSRTSAFATSGRAEFILLCSRRVRLTAKYGAPQVASTAKGGSHATFLGRLCIICRQVTVAQGELALRSDPIAWLACPIAAARSQ